MRFTSTRDHTVDCSFAEALLAGYAPDGGLFVPRHWPPPLTAMDLRNWQTLSYAQLMQRVVRRFVCPTEVTDAELRAVCEAAMEGFDVGGGDPHHKQAVPIVPLTPTPSSSCNTDHHQHQQQQQQQQQRQQQQLPNFYVAELFHGPTFCFKDLGMRAVIQLLHLLAVQQQQRSVTILVSTMGDTGPAAVQAVADLSNNNIIRNSNTPNSLSPPSPQLRIAVHFPHGQISDFQRRQMTTVAVVAPSVVRVAAFDGGGDDMDEPIKRMLSASSSQPTTTISTIEPNTTDDDLSSSSLWTGVNSYNIGRPIMQMVLYIWTYLRLAEKENWFSGYQQENGSLDTAPSLNLILPTGAMGNIVAGFMMQRMGLPIATFVAAVNINDITHQAFTTGAFHRSNNSETPMHRTLSEAINIQVPYNFERLLYYLTDCNDALVKSWYDGLAATGRIDLDDVWLTKLQSTFRSARVTDEQMCQAAARVYADYQYLADPHTAVAFSAAYQLGYLPSPPQTNASTGDNMASNTATNPVATKMASATVLLATASPCKFEEAVTAAVGKDVWMQYCESDQFPAAARHMLSLPEQTPLTIYPRKEGRTLKETQQEWEALARDVVRRMEQA